MTKDEEIERLIEDIIHIHTWSATNEEAQIWDEGFEKLIKFGELAVKPLEKALQDSLQDSFGDNYTYSTEIENIVSILEEIGTEEVIPILIWALNEECDSELECATVMPRKHRRSFANSVIVDAIVKIGNNDTIKSLFDSIKTNYQDAHFDWYLEYWSDDSIQLHQYYVVDALTRLGWKPETDEERLVYCAVRYPNQDALLEWGVEAIDPLVNILESGKTFASKALAILTKGLVETNEKEKILKFLESDDTAMIQMGVSLLKATVKK